MITIQKYSDKVCYVCIDRPSKKNALAKSTIKSLINFFTSSAHATQFNAVVLSGCSGFFSAGADLAWMKEGMKQTDDENRADAELFNEMYHRMMLYPKPIVAKVEGGAYGGAIGLVACADVAITTADAQFKFSETALGLVPATVAPYIVRKIGAGNARYLLVSGATFDGEEALQYGLIQRVVNTNELNSVTHQLAQQMAQLGPQAVTKTKELLNYLEHKSFNSHREEKDYCAQLIANARQGEESQQRVNAFFNRNK